MQICPVTMLVKEVTALHRSYNYGAASKALYGDNRLLTNADQVARNETIAWDVSFWYWSARVHDAPGIATVSLVTPFWPSTEASSAVQRLATQPLQKNASGSTRISSQFGRSPEHPMNTVAGIEKFYFLLYMYINHRVFQMAVILSNLKV